jgi:hypothetical protein
MFKRRTKLTRVMTWICFALLPALSATSLWAQSTNATLSGTITDPSGKVVPNVDVTATNVDTGIVTATRTNEAGIYVMPALQPGRYRVLVTLQGFKQITLTDVILNVQDTISRNFALELGAVSESISVEGGALLVNTESAAVGTVVDRQFVENMPLNGRTFQSLIALTPGVVLVPTGNTTVNGGGMFSVNGQRSTANAFSIDGVSANFGTTAGTGIGSMAFGGTLPALTTSGTTQGMVSLDAMQEFKIQTSSYAAEFGRQPGGQISILTRSGTNVLHGSLFDFLRNDAFDSNDWFANRSGHPRAPERQNDFGGTLGGPVFLPGVYDGRQRTFFFVSYEGLRLRLPQFTLSNVPSLSLRQQAPAGMQPFLNAFPLPNGKDLGNGLVEYSAAYSNPSVSDATSIRVDQTIRTGIALFARYSTAPSRTDTRQVFGLNQFTSIDAGSHSLTLGMASSITSHISNDLRFNYADSPLSSSVLADTFGGASIVQRSLLIPPQYDVASARAQIIFNILGFTSAQAPQVIQSGPYDLSQRQFNIVDSVVLLSGAHTFKAGLDYRKLMPTLDVNAYALQSVNFSSLQQVLSATASTGNIQANVPGGLHPRFVNISSYVQDSWKYSERVTFDLGVRWDLNPAPSERDGQLPFALTETNDLKTMQVAPAGTREYRTRYYNLAPRLGAAYRLSKTHDLVVRGGFGVFYDTGSDLAAANFAQIAPFHTTRNITNVKFPLDPAQIAPTPLSASAVPPYTLFYGFDPNLALPYTRQWNLSIERSLGQTQSITVSYVGAAGRKLLQATQTNLAGINPIFTTVAITRSTARSDYKSLQTQFRRRLSRGLQALVSYTWSHAQDDDSAGNTLRVAQYGNAAFDIRHVLTAAGSYNIPALKASAPWRQFFYRWSIDARVYAQSAPSVDLAATTTTDPATGQLIYVRPNVNPGVASYVDDPSAPCGRRINAAAFQAPPAGQSGNLGRNALRGCPAWQVDAALRRDIPVSESVKFQLRAEGFNLFNHPNFGSIQTNLTAANFGQATSMLNQQLTGLSSLYQFGGPRSFQLSLKLLF